MSGFEKNQRFQFDYLIGTLIVQPTCRFNHYMVLLQTLLNKLF